MSTIKNIKKTNIRLSLFKGYLSLLRFARNDGALYYIGSRLSQRTSPNAHE